MEHDARVGPLNKRSPTMQRLYSHIVDILKWTDRLVMASILSHDHDDDQASAAHDPRQSMPPSQLPKYSAEITRLMAELRTVCTAISE